MAMTTEDLAEVYRRPSRGMPQWVVKWFRQPMSVQKLRRVATQVEDAQTARGKRSAAACRGATTLAYFRGDHDLALRRAGEWVSLNVFWPNGTSPPAFGHLLSTSWRGGGRQAGGEVPVPSPRRPATPKARSAPHALVREEVARRAGGEGPVSACSLGAARTPRRPRSVPNQLTDDEAD